MMRAYRRFAGTGWGRALSVSQCLLLLLATSCIPYGYEGGGDGQPAAGRPDFQRPMLVELPGLATVNLAGGNLMLDRVDLTIETRLGTQSYGAVYNSTNNRWSWSFDLRYDGERFVDATGAGYLVGGLPPGARIPGTDWVRMDVDTLRRVDGMLFHFENGIVRMVQRASSYYPMLYYSHNRVGWQYRVDRILDCIGVGCADVVDLHWEHLPGSGAQLQVITDRAGREARFEYQGGQPVSARDPLDLEQLWPGYRYEYEGEGGRLSALVSSEDERIEFSYANGRIEELHQVGAQNPVHHFEYGWDAERKLWYGAVLGPDGQLCVRRYEGVGLLRELACAPDDLVAMTWNVDLRPTSRLHNGVATTWSYPDPNTVVETQPSGNVLTTVYSPTAVDRGGKRPISSVHDSLGATEYRGYNPTGRLRAIVNGEGDRVWFQYDSDQNVTAVIHNSTVAAEEPSIATQYSDFHFTGQPRVITHPNTITEHRSYDGVGNQLTGSNLARSIDPGRPGVVSRVFDGDRNLREMRVRGIGPDGSVGPEQVIRIDHRSDHQVALISRPYGGDSRFEYDELGRQIARYDVASGTERGTHTTYDASGNIRSLEQPNGMRVELDYDALDRPSEQRWLRDGVVSKVLRIAWVDGRVSELRDSTYVYQPETIHYDSAGRIARIDYPIGLAARRIEYDVRDRETATHYLQGGLGLRSIEYEYDLADRRVGVLDNGERAWEKNFVAGRLNLQIYGAPAHTFVEHRPTGQAMGRIGRVRVYSIQGGEIAMIDHYRTHCLASGDRLCTDVFATVPGAQAEGSRESFALGPIGTWTQSSRAGRRVLASLVSDSTAGGGPQAGDPSAGVHFGYDALNNIERIETLPDGPEVIFVYNGERNRLLETRDAISGDIVHSYSYDEAGYVVSRDDVPIGYDDAGFTVSIGSDIQFEWDAMGRPVSSSVEGQERYYYFGGGVLGDAAAKLLAIESDEFVIDLTQDSHLFRHYDFRNNVKLVTNDQGEVVQHFVYGPYGVAEEFGAAQGRSFAQGERIGGTGLSILGVRVLDSQVGRFLSPDPVFQLADAYSYAGGNSMDLWDPDGRHSTGVQGMGNAMATRVEIGTLMILAGAGLGTLANPLAATGYVAASQAATFAGGAMIFGGFAVAVSGTVTVAAPSGSGTPSGTGGPEFAYVFSGCSPSPLAAVPSVYGALWLLVPLQLLLGCAVAWRRSRASRGGRG